MIKQFNQTGRSMVEMLGVLAIIGVLSTAGIAGYTKAMGKFKVNEATNQISTIISNYNILMLNNTNKNELYDDSIVNQLVLPTEMLHDGQCYHALNGRCSVGHNHIATTDEFVIRFADLTKSLCIEMLTLPLTERAKRVVISEDKGNNAVMGCWGGNETSGSVTISSATKLCHNKNNVICWCF